MKDSSTLKSVSSSAAAWTVCLVAAFYFFYEFMQVTMFNAINPALMKSFSINANELSNIAIYYFYANVLALLPAGAILDRVSTKKLIIVAMIASIICTYLFSQATDVATLKSCRFVTGIAGAFAFLSCIRLASRWFPSNKMAGVVGAIVTIAMTGAMIAQRPLTYLTAHFGWRHALTYDALLGIILLTFIVGFVKDYPNTFSIEAKREHDTLNQLGLLESIKRVLLLGQNWLAGLYISLLNLPVFILGSMWGSLYLIQSHHLSTIQASSADTIFFLGLIIGSPLIGKWSDHIRNRKKPMLLATIGILLSMLLILYTSASYEVLLLLFLLLGFFSAGQVLGYPLIAESNDLALTATAEGFASVLIMSGGFGEKLSGWLLSRHHNEPVIHHITHYSHNDYLQALAILPIAFALALGCVYWIKETHGKRLKR